MSLLPDTLSGHKTSSLGLGTWVLGGGSDWGEISDSAASETVRAALAAEINFIDTAPAYGWGLCEERVGTCIKKVRKSVFLSTKCGICLNASGRPDHDLRPFSIVKECEDSLRRLQTDYIDLYQVHWPDPQVPLEDVLGTMSRLKEQGKIRSIGICNFTAEALRQACCYTEISCVQNVFSLLSEFPSEIMDFCQRKQICFIGYGVLGGGILSGKYKKEPNFRRSDARRYFYKHYVGSAFERAKEVARRVESLAQQKKVSAAAVALAWGLHEKKVSTILAGARTVEQVHQNIQALNISLTRQEREFLYHG